VLKERIKNWRERTFAARTLGVLLLLPQSPAGSRLSPRNYSLDCRPSTCRHPPRRRLATEAIRSRRKKAGNRASIPTLPVTRMSITRSHSSADITHLVIPPLYGQRMRYCKPVPVDLKICTLAANTISNSDVMEKKADVLCRKQENLQRCRNDSALCQSRIEG
jgi:hypothetical protein